MCESMVVGNVEQLDLAEAFGDKRFDVVLCLDVLEHLVEPLDTLRRLKDLLTPSGILVASIPNVTHAAVRLQLLGGRLHLHRHRAAGPHPRPLLRPDRGHRAVRRRRADRAGAAGGPARAARDGDPDRPGGRARRDARAGDRRPGRAGLPVDAGRQAARRRRRGRHHRLPTALLGEVTRLGAGRPRVREHVGWLEQQLRVKTTESERVAELDRTLRQRVTELVESHEALRAARADLEVKDAYVRHLQDSLGLPADSPAEVPPPRAAGAHAALDALIDKVEARPTALRTARLAARVARKARRVRQG
jgi:hypothetical protein